MDVPFKGDLLDTMEVEITIQAYTLLEDFQLPGDPVLERGTIVYQCIEATYGVAANDRQMTGKPYVAVTLDPNGGYPFVVVPNSILAPLLLQVE